MEVEGWRKVRIQEGLDRIDNFSLGRRGGGSRLYPASLL